MSLSSLQFCVHTACLLKFLYFSEGSFIDSTCSLFNTLVRGVLLLSHKAVPIQALQWQGMAGLS